MKTKKFQYLILIFLISFSCGKKLECTTWITDNWCEPKPGSGVIGCSRSYDVDYTVCNENHYENETVMYHEDENVKHYRLFKRKK